LVARENPRFLLQIRQIQNHKMATPQQTF
jgi:hypothetical protein